MDPINAASLLSPSSSGSGNNAMANLGSMDFLRLLVTEMTHQDPMEPMSNEDLMRQIASIRDIEMSTSLAESMRTLTGQQRFASASTLIGQFVSGAPTGDGPPSGGLVVGVRFTESGAPMLRLADGSELALDKVSTIESPQRVAEGLIGRTVVGMDQRDPAAPRPVEGVVTGVRTNRSGELMLELDNGETLRLIDVISTPGAVAA